MADARHEARFAAKETAARLGQPMPSDLVIDAALDRYVEVTRVAVEGLAHNVLDALFQWLWPGQRRALIAYLQQMYAGGDELQPLHIPRHGERE